MPSPCLRAGVRAAAGPGCAGALRRAPVLLSSQPWPRARAGAGQPRRRLRTQLHCMPPQGQASVTEQQQSAEAAVLGTTATLLQQQLPADSSLQQLLEPLLPSNMEAAAGGAQQQQQTATAAAAADVLTATSDGMALPGGDVATIAAAPSTSLTVGGSSGGAAAQQARSPEAVAAAAVMAAAAAASAAQPPPIDVEARDVPRSWRRTHEQQQPAAAAAAPVSAPFIVSPAGVAVHQLPGQQQQQAQQQQHQDQKHWARVVGVCGFAALLCYLDRTNISTAIVPMAEQYGWNKQLCSVIMSAFFAGYGATQVLGGQLSDRYGGGAVLAAGLAGWSLATVLTPVAASAGTWQLLAARAALGMAQGIAFPAIHALLAKKVPSKVRSGAIGIIMALAQCGTAIGFGASPAIIDSLGWGWTFYLFGGAALLWVPFWLHMERDKGNQAATKAAAAAIKLQRQSAETGAAVVAAVADATGLHAAAADTSSDTSSSDSSAPPQQAEAGSNNIVSSARLSAAVRPAGQAASPQGTAQHPILEALEQQQQQAAAAAAPARQQAPAAPASSSSSSGDAANVGFWPLMRRKEVWAIAVAQYAAGWGFYGLLAWLPQFFMEHCGLQLSQLGGFTLAPYLLQAVMGASAGLLADNLVGKRKWAVRDVRVLMQVTGMLGPAACLFAAASPLVHSPYLATGLITLGMGLSALTCCGMSASHLDIAPRHAGVVFGVGNTSGTLAGLVAVPGLGYVLQQTGGNWSLAFGLAAIHNVIGAALWARWCGSSPLPEDGGEQQQQQPAHAASSDAQQAPPGLKLKAA